MAILVIGSLVRVPLGRQGSYAAFWIVLLALMLREVRLLDFALPQNSRLVPQFVTRVPFWGAVQFGTEMGTGMRTFSPTGLPHALAAAVLLLGTLPNAVLAGVGFASGRALMLLTFIFAADKREADEAFDRVLPRFRLLLVAIFAPAIYVIGQGEVDVTIRRTLGVLLAAAVIGKLRSLGAFRRSLRRLGLPRSLGWLATGTILLVETLAVIAAFSSLSHRAVGLLYTGLGAAFLSVHTYLYASGQRESCACFGESSTEPASIRTVTRALIVLIGGLIVLGFSFAAR